MKTSKIYLFFQKIRHDMDTMTSRERFEHIWYHFKWHIIAILLCFIVAISMVTTVITSHKDTVIGCGLVNVSVTETGTTVLTDSYLQSLGCKTSKKQVLLFAPNITGMNSVELEHNVDFTISFVTMLGAKEIDYLILDETALNHYKSQGLFEDLRCVFSSAELQDIEELLVYSDTYDENGKALGQMYPVGICIDSLPFADECIDSATPVYLAFSGNAPHTDKLADIYEYLRFWPTAP